MNAKIPTAESDRETSQIPENDMSRPSPAAGPDENPLPPYTAIIDGQRLRQLRHQHGLSQENLAHQAQIGRTTLARLERQSRPRWRTYTLAQLAAVLQEDRKPSLYWSAPPKPARPASAAPSPRRQPGNNCQPAPHRKR